MTQNQNCRVCGALIQHPQCRYCGRLYDPQRDRLFLNHRDDPKQNMEPRKQQQ